MSRSVRVFGLSLFAWSMLFVFGCSKDLPPPAVEIEGVTSDVAWLDSASFDSLVNNEGTIAMIDFFNPACPASRQMEATISGICEEYSNDALVAKVNVTQEPGLALSYDITRVPTFVYFANGTEATRRVGVMPTDSLSVVLDSLLGVR